MPTPTQILLAVNLLEANGFVVRHKSEAVEKLDWHEAPGIGADPINLDEFKQRALEEIRKRLTVNHLVIGKKNAPSLDPEKSVTVHSAQLLIIR